MHKAHTDCAQTRPKNGKPSPFTTICPFSSNLPTYLYKTDNPYSNLFSAKNSRNAGCSVYCFCRLWPTGWTPNLTSFLNLCKQLKKPPVLTNKRLSWYARCTPNAQSSEANRFVTTAFPLIFFLKVRFSTAFLRTIACFSRDEHRWKQAADAKPV